MTGVLLASLAEGCGSSSQQALDIPRATAQSRDSLGYTAIYSFGAPPDGQQPKAGLINVNGTLYGTTYVGGAHNYGTVFTVTTAGKENVLYSFEGDVNPSASLLAVKGVLYGTTENGGSSGSAGTVFSITSSGKQKVLYKFGPPPDGAHSVAGLIAVKGKLYGTTFRGGSSTYYGTVFRITTKGNETVLHSFELYTDAANPAANLIDFKGTLYGTTESGGAATGYGYGAVFTISTTGAERVVHYFDGADGGLPLAGLIDVKGTLFGTTGYAGPNGFGTMFSITPNGSVKAVHSFGSKYDGSRPAAPLLDVKGTLYGTTEFGGAYGKGTIFCAALNGKEKVLHSFGNGPDGAIPLAGLIDVNGALYGTTSAGGTYGNGTVFALSVSRC
jgi:uncharacterized repeat protein (TIGR03803 family)